jgi:hypothetical protein
MILDIILFIFTAALLVIVYSAGYSAGFKRADELHHINDRVRELNSRRA